MDKAFLKKQKEKLEAKKIKLETQLGSFAEKSNQSSNDWDSKMPMMDPGKSLEEEADEVEEFNTRLSLEHTLENELKDVNLALEEIKKGKYGICTKCGKPIAKGRLEVYPQARTCTKCH